jgi:hypothetical protein
MMMRGMGDEIDGGFLGKGVTGAVVRGDPAGGR